MRLAGAPPGMSDADLARTIDGDLVFFEATFRALLADTPFELLPCRGTYFQLASYARLSDEPDTVLAERLTQVRTDHHDQDLFLDRARWQAWCDRYLARLGQADLAQVGQVMLRSNPKFVLRNHLAEIAIRQAQLGNFAEMDTLHILLKSPFDEHPGFEAYADLPPDWASQLEISCSS
mgnify:CR=1 FL=1